MCFSKPQSAMTCCHSAIERPYFFSMEGKYGAYDVACGIAEGGDSQVPFWLGRGDNLRTLCCRCAGQFTERVT
jgi:hypothetical protein